MDFLIDPNVSYVLLVLGFLISILSLLAPGTGILEITALLMIALAGYGIVNLPLNLWAFLIILLGVVPFVVGYLKNLRWQNSIALSTVAFVLGAAFLYRGDNWFPAVNIFLILFLAPIIVGVTWFISKKSLEAIRSRPTMNVDNLIGTTGITKSDIRGQGTIYANGEEWTASSKIFIPTGKQVRIISRSGFVLEVEPIESETSRN